MTHPYYDAGELNDISEENELSEEPHIFTVPYSLAGERLDAALAKLMPDYSRSRLAQWIKDGHVTVNDQIVQPKTKLLGDECLKVEPLAPLENLTFEPEAIEFPIVYEDEHILVVNKPAGLVVHPAAGNWTGTLLNGLLHHCPALSQVPRAGIVHRLDKDTSGLMVVAKTVAAQVDLVRQLQERTVKRIYRAVADGVVPFDGSISTNIGRDPHNRLKMAVLKFGGKSAITHIRVLERFEKHSYVECRLETGRTHQIRVHMKEAKHPLTGDPVYNQPRYNKLSPELADAIKSLNRQALHAYSLSLVHPHTGEVRSWTAKLPADMVNLLDVLRGKPEDVQTNEEIFAIGGEMDDEDWDEDDEDGVEVVYVKE